MRGSEARVHPGVNIAPGREAAPQFIRPPSLPHIPVFERQRSISKERLSVARHEANHIFAAFLVGGEVHSVSVKPEGNSLGRTQVSASLEAFQIIAAAGTVGPGAAGYGGDLSQIARIDRYLEKKPGSSIDSAIATATSLIYSHYPKEVQEKVAEMIAFVGEASGGEIRKMINRAFWEVANEENNFAMLRDYKTFSTDRKEKYDYWKKENVNVPDGAVVIDVSDTTITFKHKSALGVVETKTRCRICGKEGVHSHDEQGRRERRGQENKIEKSNIPIFEHEATIYKRTPTGNIISMQ